MTAPLKQERSQAELDNHWHLDKRVPLAIVVALILQTIYFTIFITKLDSRVSSLESDHIDTRKTVQDMAEIKIHQQYLKKDFEDLNRFLRDDVEWIKPKSKRAR